ncbi:MAG: fluoride efflux transporter CrcB [Alphaproteobacteria bacterium]|nr:fluoride efflux transporter CrcB [Alphaproteobacteria bacterium]
MNALALIYVGFGGGFGAILRYLAIDVVSRLNPTEFPYGTMAVNVLGCLLMGAWIASMTVLTPAKAKDLHLLFATGALGGFTTFSAFSFDIFFLAERGLYGQAALYVAGSVLLSFVGLLAGVMLVKLVAA